MENCSLAHIEIMNIREMKKDEYKQLILKGFAMLLTQLLIGLAIMKGVQF